MKTKTAGLWICTGPEWFRLDERGVTATVKQHHGHWTWSTRDSTKRGLCASAREARAQADAHLRSLGYTLEGGVQ